LSQAVVFFAHPYPKRSRANRALLRGLEGLADVSIRSLYELYPDFAIDVDAEQAALTSADVVVWQHPLYWYSVPGLLKHWFDKVLARGWAYGEGGTALQGKRCLWVTTAGSPDPAYTPEGVHGHELEAFVPVVKQTARFCRMLWEEPLVVKHAHGIDDEALRRAGSEYRERLAALLAEGQ
jgi:glutathione-regulated potassium-efflux system ancillary protein KefF